MSAFDPSKTQELPLLSNAVQLQSEMEVCLHQYSPAFSVRDRPVCPVPNSSHICWIGREARIGHTPLMKDRLAK
jgi:hypothetical protein